MPYDDEYSESSADYRGDFDDFSREFSCASCGGSIRASFVSASDMEGALCADCYEEQTGEINW